jgi:hypothetical protein
MSCEGENKGKTCGSEEAPRGVHVSVFPAWGDHANYPETCIEICEETGNPVPENEHGGIEAWGNNGNPGALLKMPATGTEAWVDWPGAWGNEGQASPETPPMSPGNQKPHFMEPWLSECRNKIEVGLCTLKATANNLLRHANSEAALSGLSPLTDATNVRTGSAMGSPLGADHYCANSFGSGIQAALCTPHELAKALGWHDLKASKGLTFRPSLRSHVAAAPGITQAAVTALAPGKK